MVEIGDPEQIVRAPRHAYTQLLIRSIPEPDPQRNWGDDEEEGNESEELASAAPGTDPARSSAQA